MAPAVDEPLYPLGYAMALLADTLWGMCRRVECSTCHRPTYAGCGNHVEQVLGDVPADKRCDCAAQRALAKADRPKRTWFGRRTTSGT